MNNNIKRCVKKAKENWIGEQCSEIEENLRKNNSKRAHQLVKDLTTVKQGKVTTVQDRSGKCLTEEREMLNQWTEYCTELYNHKASGDPSVLDCPKRDTENDHNSWSPTEMSTLTHPLQHISGKDHDRRFRRS